MRDAELLTRVQDHCSRFFEGHEQSVWEWTQGPIGEVAPWFKTLRFAPGPKIGLWSYVSLGASLLSTRAGRPLEFLLLTEHETPRAVELLAMIAHYHHEHRLGVFNSLPVGQPWLDGATCDHFLVSLPYPLGADLEQCLLPEGIAQILWLLPIKEAEARFKRRNGVDALEEKFDEAAIEYWRVDRESVI